MDEMKRQPIYLFHIPDCKDWSEILKDKTLKPYIQDTLIWSDKLMLYLKVSTPGEIESYLNIKWGEYRKDIEQFIPDLKPKMYKDYIPKKTNTYFDKFVNK